MELIIHEQYMAVPQIAVVDQSSYRARHWQLCCISFLGVFYKLHIAVVHAWVSELRNHVQVSCVIRNMHAWRKYQIYSIMHHALWKL